MGPWHATRGPETGTTSKKGELAKFGEDYKRGDTRFRNSAQTALDASCPPGNPLQSMQPSATARVSLRYLSEIADGL